MSIILNRFAFFFFTLSVIGLFLAEYAKAVPSIAMIGLILCAITYWIIHKKMFQFSTDMVILSGGVVLLYAIQFITSDNYDYLFERIRIKLPFIFLPLSFLFIQPFSKQNLTRLALVFITITTTTAAYITIKFILNYDVYIELIKQSQIVPGPINHIRFSLMAASCAFLSYFLLYDQSIKFHSYVEFGLKASMIFLILFIHIYSVRSGMIALYALIFYFLMKFLFQKGTWKQWIIYVGLFLASPFIAYYSSNSIQSKVNATLADISEYKQNKGNEFNSLGKRMVSYEVAFQVFLENPLFGCGIGDLENTNRRIFKEEHPDIQTVIIPHNQFIYLLMGSGLIGTLIFSFAFYFPLFFKQNYHNSLLVAQYIILTLSFQTEPMLETQLGVAFSILFILFPWLWIRSSADVTPSV